MVRFPWSAGAEKIARATPLGFFVSADSKGLSGAAFVSADSEGVRWWRKSGGRKRVLAQRRRGGPRRSGTRVAVSVTRDDNTRVKRSQVKSEWEVTGGAKKKADPSGLPQLRVCKYKHLLLRVCKYKP